MSHTYGNEKNSSRSTTSFQPTASFLQTRAFAPLQTDLDEDATPRPSGYTENFLEKIINQRSTEPSDTPVQAKPMNRLMKPLQSKRMAIQAKLNIGEPNDKYEQEADATASKVVQQINSQTQDKSIQREAMEEEEELQMKSISSIQREAMEEEEELQMKPISSIQREAMEEEEELQMKSISSIQREAAVEDEELQMKFLVQRRENLGGGEASTDLESSIQSARGSGQSLDAGLQAKMGQAMGADFSGVKVHTDSQSDQLNKSIQAKAFTTGQDVFFRQGAYEPSSRGGQELIAHELTHVVQQNAGTVQKLPQLQEKSQHEHTTQNKSLIQPKRVEVSGGIFSDENGDGYKIYKPENGLKYKERGAQMSGLSFTPNKGLRNASGELAKEVSLVQTTNSTIIDVDNPHAEDQAESLLNERRTSAGSAIDQQIYIKPEKVIAKARWQSEKLADALNDIAGSAVGSEGGRDNNTWQKVLQDLYNDFQNGIKSHNEEVEIRVVNTLATKLARCKNVQSSSNVIFGLTNAIATLTEMLNEQKVREKQLKLEQTKVNLDPRYHEDRHTELEPLKQTQPSGTAPSGTTGWPATRARGEDDWKGDAMLRDRPAHTVENEHSLRGSEKFEVSAMTDQNLFVGSVSWGWNIDGDMPELDPATIELNNSGSASKDFFEAAEKWNQMAVEDLVTDDIHTTMQLPTLASIKKHKKTSRLTMWLMNVLKRYPNAQQFHFDKLNTSEFGEFLLTGKIASWERIGEDDEVSTSTELLTRTYRDVLSEYPNGEQYINDLSTEEWGEFVVTGEIARWEEM